jgi:hypothetical protein
VETKLVATSIGPEEDVSPIRSNWKLPIFNQWLCESENGMCVILNERRICESLPCLVKLLNTRQVLGVGNHVPFGNIAISSHDGNSRNHHAICTPANANPPKTCIGGFDRQSTLPSCGICHFHDGPKLQVLSEVIELNKLITTRCSLGRHVVSCIYPEQRQEKGTVWCATVRRGYHHHLVFRLLQ